MKNKILLFILLQVAFAKAQLTVKLPENPEENSTRLDLIDDKLEITWPVGDDKMGQVTVDLNEGKPVFYKMAMGAADNLKPIATGLDPVFMLNVGKRTLKPENGWTIFFDKVPTRPYESYTLDFIKKGIKITKKGERTTIIFGEMSAPDFKGNLEMTIYTGVPLLNIEAVVTTQKDSVAILYDAGLMGEKPWKNIAFADPLHVFKEIPTTANDTATITAVSYRSILGSNDNGSVAIFPAPHHYFYPLDEAYNLKSTWYGKNYRDSVKKYGMGIRQDPEGDHRYVPWFNAPPGTAQRLGFFCLLGDGKPQQVLEHVKKYTHSDQYRPLKGYKTMASHFHNEFIMNVVRAGKEIPEKPEFVDVFKNMGVNIVHLGEFHYTAHPKGPDEQRLSELRSLFEQCARLSDTTFLLLPGEEPNEFLGGHWMALFPKPVYWIMAREADKPFVSQDSVYGKVYRISDKDEMLSLLQQENGLAWTAHPRIKGSTGYPDTYKNEPFFKSDRFLGGAWKAMPADLSLPRLGTRVLDLMDDMNNWGDQKKVIAEADLFSITLENEMYAHMNINYLQMDTLPTFEKGWQPVLNVIESGRFFSTTGEILLPTFTVNGRKSGETLNLSKNDSVNIQIAIDWTFPLNFVEIISGDGKKVFHEKIDISDTKAFGSKTFRFSPKLAGRKWVRLEVWDIAANGAFTQTVYLNE